jgi:hypothetical protein
MSRAIALSALAFVLSFAALPASAASLTLVGANTKLCQLTGDIDWVSGAPTAARTQTKSNLIAVDLGFPIDTGAGGLYFLFGDSFPLPSPVGDPDDALGWTTQTATPDAQICIDLKLATPAFDHPTVTPAIKQGSFNVPTGGVFVDDTLYAFFWTNHCAGPNAVLPLPGTPLVAPAFNPANPACLENASLNSIGRSAFAHASPTAPSQFTQVFPSLSLTPPFIRKAPVQMPSGFVYVSAVHAPLPDLRARHPILPMPIRRQEGIAIFGAARYRASIPYLAVSSAADFADPTTWRFYSSTGGWLTRTHWESGHNLAGDWVPPKGAEIYAAGPKGSERCVGEHQVTWNAPLHVWLLTYNCGVESIKARTAPEPWGPWSAPTTLIDKGSANVYCTLMMKPIPPGCPGLFNYWGTPPVVLPVPLQQGAFYAPYVLNRYTQDATAGAGQPKRATITWLLSTWNPYQVTVMQSTLEMTP